MRTKRLATLSFFLLAACLAFGQAHAARVTQWSIVDLGGLSNQGSVATDINDRGDVVGYSFVPVPGGGGTNHTFLWQGGALQDLVAPPGGFAYSTPRGLNHEGTVLAQDIDGKAWTWRNGVWTDLGVTFPSDLNKSGAVTGNYYAPNSALRAYVYKDGLLRDIGDIGGFNTFPAAMNDKGMVVGNASIAFRIDHAFVYDNGVITDIGTFGGTNSYAIAVNNHGVVVGGAEDASGIQKAFTWDAKAGMRQLLDLPGSSYASAINDHGQIVVFVNGRANLYDHGELTPLDSLPEVRAAGFSELVPMDINDLGSIVGMGFHANGAPASGFVLLPR